MKKAEWLNLNRMKIETGHKTFDRQANCVGTGNRIANTQFSSHIRPRSCVECNGMQFPLGHLRDYDFNWWTNPRLPLYVRKYVESVTKTKAVWLYQFHHWLKDKRIVHGYIVTDHDDGLLRKFVTGPTYKSGLVIDEMAEYVSC